MIKVDTINDNVVHILGAQSQTKFSVLFMVSQ